MGVPVLEPNKIETRFRCCQAQSHFVVNSNKSLIFCF